ncbi:hypothetical protein PVAR5_2112 [Paecilomyces variotii No. 5]|uniref:Transcription factor domain-containing protein n=1 Tax=Byssochlamys spectabilis (strain No. 5 / NBRC 109023) TaxID=1356009 RepID=V5FUV6_BYSSN|nr:hypothetical protein PVAR5_2112 [Paecilomyces variotii No. 5]
MSPKWTRLIRFIAEEDGQVHLGEVDAKEYPDIGLAALKGEKIVARLIHGSIFDGVVTEKTLQVARLLSPIGIEDVSIIRCLGLNYRDHAREANMAIPDVPVLFIKPRTALNGPYPAKINVPKIAQDGSSDYEAELSVILSKSGRDIPESEAMDYVLGYTCSNDVSARTQQFKNSQWCFSKGFDGSCPLGPVLVSQSVLSDPHNLQIKAIHNGSVVQNSNTREMIFNIPSLISFLSQGTTLEKGTVIMTGTGPGIGAMRNPKVVLNDNDDMRVEIEQIGTLVNSSVQRQRRRCRERPTKDDLCHHVMVSSLSPDAFEPTREPFSNKPSVGGSSSPVAGDICDVQPLSELHELRKPRLPDLSFILHPAHETSSPHSEQTADAHGQSSIQDRHLARDQACLMLGLKREAPEFLIKTYFDNMVAVNLFHEPSFYEKLRKITSLSEICALLAAMAAWCVRFVPKSEEGRLFDLEMETHEHSVRFLDLAVKYIEESLEECGDLTPPICVLQATILAAHSYEMNLHLVDIGGPRNSALSDVDRWCEDEEKRRAWWAIWEMDVFATTIRRTPTGLDWSQIETLLPVEDGYWFQREPQQSCFLERDPIDRWKALQDSGNQSPKAWYIVINSLMKDAQRISSPRGIPNGNSSSCRRSGVDNARHRLETIANAVQCFRLALPSHLRYNNQYLGFDARIPGQYSSKRQEHCSIYNIYMMIQLARLMIYRYDTFGDHGIFALFSHGSDTSTSSTESHSQTKSGSRESLAVKQYLEAADDLLALVLQSSDGHIQHINPFLSNTIWLASARDQNKLSSSHIHQDLLYTSNTGRDSLHRSDHNAKVTNTDEAARPLPAFQSCASSRTIQPMEWTSNIDKDGANAGTLTAPMLDFMHFPLDTGTRPLEPENNSIFPTTTVDPFNFDEVQYRDPLLSTPSASDIKSLEDLRYAQFPSDLQDILSVLFTS